MESKQKIFLIIAVIAILTIALVLIAVLQPSEYKKTYNTQYQTCMEQNQKKYSLLIARKTGDSSYCDEAQEIKELCIAYAAKDANKYCADIEPGYEKAKQRCIAEATGDASNCPEKDFWCMAKAGNDLSYCQSLETQEDILECERSLPQNAEYWKSAEAEEQCKKIATNAAENKLRLENI